MSTLFAHHLEPQHLPVILGMLAAGFWIGWNGVARWSQSRERAGSDKA